MTSTPFSPEHVDPAKLHDVWDWVLPGIELARRRARASSWRPEDVYAQIRNGNVQLFLIEDRGGIVLQRLVDYDGPTLFVWLIWGELAELEPQLWQWLREMRDRGGYRRVWWRSPRRWDAREGVRLREHVYELE